MAFQLILALVLIFGAIAYSFWHLWTLLPLPSTWKVILLTAYFAGIMLIFVIFGFRGKGLSVPVTRLVYQVGTTALFSLLYVFLYFLLLDILRLCHVLPSMMWQNSWTGTIVFCSILLTLGLIGFIRFHHPKRVELTLHATEAQLAENPTLHGKKLFMATDIHLGYIIRRHQLAQWIDKMNQENPDIILIAGDITDGSIVPIDTEQMAQEFHRLKAPVYACLGNHEFYCGLDNARRFYHEAGIHLLIDSVAIEQGIRIVGRNDFNAPHRHALSELIAPDSSIYTIVLDHQPRDLAGAEQTGADLVLFGHTHNGQLWPGNFVVKNMYELGYGLLQKGKTTFYTSSGLGLWGARYRIGTSSEYIVASIQ